MADLAAFLLDRIAEDEAAAQSSYTTLLIAKLDRCAVEGSDEHATFRHHERWEPARVLAECAAKRRIVAEHESSPSPWDAAALRCDTCAGGGGEGADWPCPTLRLLALPYADAPGYDEAWRP